MDPITWTIALQVLRKYWWVLLVIAAVIYIFILREAVKSKTEANEILKGQLVVKAEELKNLKTKVDAQNKAIEDMALKGKEQALRLDSAIKRVNDMKPATQVIIREIYTDKAKDANQLLLNALSD